MLKRDDFFMQTNLDEYKRLLVDEDIINIFNNKKSYIDEVINENLEKVNENRDINDNNKISEFVIIEGNVIIGKNVKIDAFTKIEGPVIIGDNVEISTNAYIRPYTILENGVKVGHGSEIKNAIIMENAKVATNVFVGDSIIGKSTRIGSGTILANRRFDQKEIKIKKDNEKIETKTDFFGAIIGDNSRIGANVTLLPGTVVGHDTFVMPGAILHGTFESDVLINNLENQKLIITAKERIELKK